MGVEARVLGGLVRSAFVFVSAAILLTTSFPPGFALANGPTEVVLVDIVELRRSYRDEAGSRIQLGSAEFFSEDGSPDLEASVGYLEGLGVSALEVYGSYVLARIDDGTKAQLESLGIRAEAIPQRTRIPIDTYLLDTKVGEPAIPDALRAAPPTGGASGDFIVQFLGPFKPGWVDRIEAVGGEIKQLLGPFVVVVEMTAAEAADVRSLGFVEWTGLYHPAYKIPPRLLDEVGVLNIRASIYSDHDLPALSSFIEERGGTILDAWHDGLRIQLDADYLGPLARLRSVSRIEMPSVASETNSDTTGILQSGGVGSRPIFARGILGQGQLLTVADQGIYEIHEAFYDPDPFGPNHRKIEAVVVFPGATPGDATGHGSHVAGTLAGDAPTYNTYNLYDGHAFAGRLYVQDIGDSDGVIHDPGDLEVLFDGARANGSWIHSNSWGSCPIPILGGCGNSDYGFNTRDIDEFVEAYPNFVIVFAAGNEALNFGDESLQNEAHAKNAIVVGSLNGALDVAADSSRGTTIDGRIAPTVVAPGVCIMSVRSPIDVEPSCTSLTNYIEASGTSMATPAVAGSVALIRQYLMEGWYPTGTKVAADAVTPSASLLKAFLVNSAVQLTSPSAFEYYPGFFPNSDQGWGRPLLDDVLYFGLQGETRRTGWKYVTPGLSAGESVIFKISVTSTSGPMNLALVWTDPAANAGCNPCLMNDLDLTLRSPGGYWYHGNLYECAYALPPGPPYESCEHQYPWQLTLDRKNNVETFYALPTFPTGEWEVRVSAPFITSGPQAFALVLTGHGLTQDVSGVVRDASSNSPIANAKVTLTGSQNSYTTFTATDGSFSIVAAADDYSRTTDRCDYLPDTGSFTTDPGFPHEEDVALTKRGLGTVWGKVTDIYGTPLSGAWVRETCTGNQYFTDTDGSYSIQVPGGVDVQVKASHVGYYLSTKTVNVAPGARRNRISP